MERQAITKTQTSSARVNHQTQSVQPSSAQHPLADLQSSFGNVTVQRLIRSPYIQAKLNVSSPGDQSEREADRVADKVMRMPDPQATRGATVSIQTRSSRIHRKCAGCEEEMQRPPSEEKEETIQPKTNALQTPAIQRLCSECGAAKQSSSIGAPAIVQRVLRSPGQALDGATRAFFEPRFGHDFSRVRVHADAEAAESARAVNALAYTVGGDVVFGAARYAPRSTEGRSLLAHELTHTIQQGASGRQTNQQNSFRDSSLVATERAETAPAEIGINRTPEIASSEPITLARAPCTPAAICSP